MNNYTLKNLNDPKSINEVLEIKKSLEMGLMSESKAKIELEKIAYQNDSIKENIVSDFNIINSVQETPDEVELTEEEKNQIFDICKDCSKTSNLIDKAKKYWWLLALVAFVVYFLFFNKKNK